MLKAEFLAEHHKLHCGLIKFLLIEAYNCLIFFFFENFNNNLVTFCILNLLNSPPPPSKKKIPPRYLPDLI